MCKPAIICMHYLYAFYGALYPSDKFFLLIIPIPIYIAIFCVSTPNHPPFNFPTFFYYIQKTYILF